MAEFNEERILIEKAIGGDELSFETLILSCKGKAYSIAFRYMKNEHDAMDVLQDSFIKIFKNLSSFNYESRFDTWVYRIVVNTCNDALRKAKNRSNVISMTPKDEEDEEYELNIPDKSAGPEEQYQKKEESAYILECMDKLVQEHREIIILRDIKGFSYEEISEILDCSLGTVKSRISRARLRLKEIYISGMKE